MNQQNNQHPVIEDLAVTPDRAEEVKGGGQLGTVKWEDDKLNDIRL